MKALIIALMTFICLSATNTGASADDLQDKSAVLTLITKTAADLCNNIPLQGRSTQVELSGEAKAELNSLIKFLTDLGIQGASNINSEEYTGLLQNDLGSLVIANPDVINQSDCRLKVFEKLKDDLLPRSQVPRDQLRDDGTEALRIQFLGCQWQGSGVRCNFRLSSPYLTQKVTLYEGSSRLVEQGGQTVRGSRAEIAAGGFQETLYAGITEHAWIQFAGVNPNAKTADLILNFSSESEGRAVVIFRDVQLDPRQQ
jgi:hypothetical protein